ncbi:MAG: hypothetical protein IJ617_06605, partial [Oscillospiraceae bacterium]|nr:hypothetical protein [Oscillospiraceae bacterium]
LRRMLWGAALGLRRGDASGTPPYLRALAANAKGRAVLATLRGREGPPVLVKPSKPLRDERAARIFALGAAAADFFALGFPKPSARRGGTERELTPFIASW